MYILRGNKNSFWLTTSSLMNGFSEIIIKVSFYVPLTEKDAKIYSMALINPTKGIHSELKMLRNSAMKNKVIKTFLEVFFYFVTPRFL